MQFEVKRTLKHASKIYRDHYEHYKYVPAYAFLHNFFYFPIEDRYPEIETIDSDVCISHEVGHHLHSIINLQVKEGIMTFIRTGKRPEGHKKLTEIVAEYSNLILGARNCNDPLYECAYKDVIKAYSQYGPEFLPVLSRMRLDEAIGKKIVVI